MTFFCRQYMEVSGGTWRHGFLRIAREKEIGKEAYRVLFALLGSESDGNFISISRWELADILHMDPSNVTRATKLLEKKGVIKRRILRGRTVGYEIMEFFGAGLHD